MSLLDRFFGGLLTRPALPLPGPIERADSTVNPLTGLGGITDKGAAARPNRWSLALGDDELRALYANNGMARRIVDLVPSRATRRGWTSPEIPTSEYKRLRAWARVRDAMQMGGLYGDGLLLLVTEDDIPPAFRARPNDWLREPLDIERIGALHALQVFDAGEAAPMAWDEELTSPGFRMPALWSLSTPGAPSVVHASRVIVFRGSRRPPSETRWSLGRSNVMPDASVLQVVWEEIRHLTETMQGGATLAAELREGVLKVGNLAAKATGDEAGALVTRISLMQRTKSLLGLILLGPEDEYENRGNAPTGFVDLSDAAKSMLAAATGIPEVVLFGATPGGLNTDGDSAWEGFRQLVSDHQERHREELEYLDRVIYAAQDGPTGGLIPEDGELTFAPLDEPDQDALAKTRKTVAETDALYIQAGVYGPQQVAMSRFGEDGWVFELEVVPIPDPADEEQLQVALAAELAKAGAAGGQAQPGEADPKADAAQEGGCCILVPAADPGLLRAVERAIGQQLVAERSPHVTVLYLGELPSDALPEVVAAVTAEASDTRPDVAERAVVRTFPPGPYGTPIVVELEEAWGLGALNERLLRRLAHLVTARQFPRFRAHMTLGYARSPLTPEAVAALVQVDASAVRVPVTVLLVTRGEEVVATVPVTG